jgi:hypothetical protein
MVVTKTLGPLHFEDLDPHRFEDLIRELISDFINPATTSNKSILGG